jgi:4-hydroxythreonine-4-phosphate dehydrogenase
MKREANSKSKKIRLGISVGDINGIGLEVIMKAFADNRMFDFCTPIVYGSSKWVMDYQKEIGSKALSFNFIKNSTEAKSNRANLISCWDEEVTLELGKETADGGKYALKSLVAAVEALKNEEVDALLTAPINKHNIQSDEFSFPGHTEFLAQVFGDNEALMLMVSGGLRIGVLTGHIPLADVSKSITEESILKKLEMIDLSLRQDFNIRKPKIAVLGLNPHSGDKGVIGKEDEEIIRPTVQKAFDSGKLVYGPYAADSFFGSNVYNQFDAILAMYHDQGLIPFKTMSFNKGVNFTAGISIVRTSPDHGTAFDLAGKDEANESSFREAIYAACKLYSNRNEWQTLNSDALKISAPKNKREYTRGRG